MFEMAKIEIEKFDVIDIITTSNVPGEIPDVTPGENQLPAG